MTDIKLWANWIARDADGRLVMFENKPQKGRESWLWLEKGNKEVVTETDTYYSFVKWEDEEPTMITVGDYQEKQKRGMEMNANDYANELTELDETALEEAINDPDYHVDIDAEGMEIEDTLANFLPKIKDGYVSHRIGSAIEILLRHSDENGIEDLKMARKNMDQIISYLER